MAPNSTSGAMKPAVPNTAPGASPRSRATPRSPSTGRPRRSSSTLSGARSACTTPAAWSPASVRATGATTVTASPTLR